MAKLDIALFGGLSMEVDGRPLPQIPSRAGRSLFAYLVTHRDTAPTRDLLAGMFWSDMLETQARRRLSHALWQIQAVLSESAGLDTYLDARPTTVRFNPAADVTVDVDEFDATLATVKSHGDDPGPARSLSRLIDAARLYRGDFMAGFYDDWIVVEQERLRQGHFAILSHIVRLSKSQGDFEQALLYARRLALLNPLREDAHREIMRLTYLLGRPNEALQQYERCVSILASELGAEPSTETRALRLEIASGRESPILPFSHTSRTRLFEGGMRIPLVGRAPERQAMIELMEDALARRGGIVLMEGDSGTGKTRFLAESAEDANWRGLNVVWGAFPSGGINRPFEGLAGALETSLTELRVQQLREKLDPVWLQSLAPLIPAMQRWASDLGNRTKLQPGEERDRVREAFLRVFLALAELTPTVLVLDDAHRADGETLAALGAIAPRLAASPLLICLAYRRDELREQPGAWELVRALDRSGPVKRISLEPLSATETGELVRRLLPDGARPEVVNVLQSATGGNPLFVLETLRAIHEQQVTDSLKPPDALAGIDLDNLPLSNTVAEQLSRRLARLPGDARHVARVLAASGGGLPMDCLESTVDLPRPQMLDAVETLTTAGMVSTDQRRYALSHDQLVRVAYASIPEGERISLHERIGLELERSGTSDATVLAHHFTEGGVPDRAARYLERAGNEAESVGGYSAARDRLEQALRQWAAVRSSSRDQIRILLSLERMYDILGEPEARRRTLDELGRAARNDPRLGAEVMHRRASLSAARSDLQEAALRAEQALQMHAELGDEVGQARDWRILGRIHMESGRYDDAAAALEKGRSHAELGTQLDAELLHALSDVQAERSQFADARRTLDAAASTYERLGDRRGVAATLSSLAFIEGSTGDEAVASTLESAANLCEEIGYRYGVAINALNLGVHHFSNGRIAQALSPTGHARSVFQSLANGRGEAMALANLAAMHVALGDDSAARLAEAGLAMARAHASRASEAHCLATLARVSLADGDTAEAERRVTEAAAMQDIGPAVKVQLTRIVAEIRAAQDRTDEALQVAGGGLERCRELGLGWLEGRFHEVLAEVFVRRGEPKRALEHTANPSGIEALPLLYWRRRAFLELGEWEAGHETLVEAHDALIRQLEGLSDEETKRALARLPLHREIHRAWKTSRPRVVTVLLAAASAPTGRPLTEDEFIPVAWTVDHAIDAKLSPGPARRSHQLVRLMEEAAAAGAAPTVNDLASVLGVSPATLRRDLAALRKQGIPVHTRGSRS